MSDTIINLLNGNLKRDTLKNLSLNDNYADHNLSVKHLIDSDKKCFDFDKIHPNNRTIDALDYNNESYFLIEFKDQKVYIPPVGNKGNDRVNISKIVFKAFQSINSILELYIKNNLPKTDFYSNKLYFLVVFSSTKSTDLNDFKTLKTHLKEKYGNILEIDILDKRMFIDEYVNTNKVGI